METVGHSRLTSGEQRSELVICISRPGLAWGLHASLRTCAVTAHDDVSWHSPLVSRYVIAVPLLICSPLSNKGTIESHVSEQPSDQTLNLTGPNGTQQ